ncbi:MAG: GNAT family N-acetyltransferase, partial [Bacillaceae bacterium]
HNGKTVGRMEILVPADENGKAYMGMLIGEDSLRHQGIGRAAMALFKSQYLPMMNIKEIIVEVYRHNPISIAFFEKVGFKQTGVMTTELYRGKEVPLIQLAYVYER